jgi:hypothetical protein
MSSSIFKHVPILRPEQNVVYAIGEGNIIHGYIVRGKVITDVNHIIDHSNLKSSAGFLGLVGYGYLPGVKKILEQEIYYPTPPEGKDDRTNEVYFIPRSKSDHVQGHKVPGLHLIHTYNIHCVGVDFGGGLTADITLSVTALLTKLDVAFNINNQGLIKFAEFIRAGVQVWASTISIGELIGKSDNLHGEVSSRLTGLPDKVITYSIVGRSGEENVQLKAQDVSGYSIGNIAVLDLKLSGEALEISGKKKEITLAELAIELAEKTAEAARHKARGDAAIVGERLNQLHAGLEKVSKIPGGIEVAKLQIIGHSLEETKVSTLVSEFGQGGEKKNTHPIIVDSRGK